MRIKHIRRNGTLNGFSFIDKLRSINNTSTAAAINSSIANKTLLQQSQAQASQPASETIISSVPTIQTEEQQMPTKTETLISKIQNTVADGIKFMGDTGIIKPMQTAPQVQQPKPDNTMLYLGGAAILLFILMKKK
jgi:hypothetical protein